MEYTKFRNKKIQELTSQIDYNEKSSQSQGAMSKFWNNCGQNIPKTQILDYKMICKQ